jgi:hypothetical protein
MWVVAAMVWTLLWSLGSKLFQGHLLFKRHLSLLLQYGQVWMALDAALPMLAFMTSWTWLSRITGLVCTGVLCRLIWAHLAVILPTHRRGLMAAVAALYMGGIGLSVWLIIQNMGQPFSERYTSALLPPAWRLASTQAPEALINDARGMKARLEHQARDSDADDGDDDVPDEEE